MVESAESPRERIGPLLGFLLLLAAPAFYVLLWFKPYSWSARVGWGLWVGLILFVVLSGMDEPAIPIAEMMRQQGYPEETIPGRPSLDAYLRRLGGGPLGTLIDDYTVEGRTITLWFRANDSYFDSDIGIARSGIGSGFSLFYGRDFERIVYRIPYRGATLVMELNRDAFNEHFGMSAAEMAALGTSNERFEQSRLRDPDEADLRAFFQRFTRFE